MQSARLDLTAKLEPAAMQVVETPPDDETARLRRSTFNCCKYPTTSPILALLLWPLAFW